ncbi:helix-turn-helix domain-containing protein [Pseudooceanicola sp. 216_PA32_1]|uniref:Helix-turn-helix domain-containing protein n=1 Tax=Pseudooceanicola pacificus TaxID=2676438 RepID=A0A844WEK8_9RHOB|nr:IclR family transcriptional regulator [Pseudooceanicola pacificus]MWB79142.1 helix-turn-helix domain-containing protein [Pseudooceanicola pacificus]
MDDGSKTRSGTQSVDRAFDILDAIARSSPSGASLKHVCETTGLTKPTVHRILVTLQERGIVEKQLDLRYHVGRELTLLGLSSELRRFRELASPALSQLSDAIGDAVFLSVRSGLDTVCADRRIGSFPIQVLSIEIGSRRPLGISANSVAILSRVSRAQAEEVLTQNVDRLRAYGVPMQTLRDRISDARRRGYTVLPRAIAKGTSAIAFPITDVLGRPVAAISTIAISSRQRGARVGALVDLLGAATAEISLAITAGQG